jgi:hypothetical protein
MQVFLLKDINKMLLDVGAVNHLMAKNDLNIILEDKTRTLKILTELMYTKYQQIIKKLVKVPNTYQ